MPAALQRVESSSKFLEEASRMLHMDPYSQPARKKLIGKEVRKSERTHLLMKR